MLAHMPTGPSERTDVAAYTSHISAVRGLLETAERLLERATTGDPLDDGEVVDLRQKIETLRVDLERLETLLLVRDGNEPARAQT